MYLILILILYSITRDNVSSNDTLISAFKRHYDLQGIKFQGDILCLVHVLNLVVQDILKALIKEAYNELDNIDEEEILEEDINNSKSFPFINYFS